jgi:hypothetical protein
MSRTVYSASLGIFLVVTVVGVAAADPLVVRSGSFSFDTGDPYVLNVVGDGFDIGFGGGPDAISFHWTFPQICVPDGCQPGTMFTGAGMVVTIRRLRSRRPQ